MDIEGRWIPCASRAAVKSSPLHAYWMLTALSALMACSGAVTVRPAAPTTPPLQQNVILNTICERQTFDVSVNKCGDFYSTYPTGFVVDAATEIFDKDGNHVDSCGGNRAFVSPEARQESERKCAAYQRDCTQVLKACSSRVDGGGGDG